MILEFLERHKIEREIEEPSGLALGRSGKSLWTVSDSQRKLFEIDLLGRLVNSFPIRNQGLEGITFDSQTEKIFAVDEDASKIITLSSRGEELGARRLREMEGFDQIGDYFADVGNKGLEGIAFCEPANCLYMLKEGQPGLLIEVTADLQTISASTRLSADNGFIDDKRSPKKIDYSGICYDSQRDRLWIVSDRARRLYLFDPIMAVVEYSFELEYEHRGKKSAVAKAEGIAVDPHRSLIYLVCDNRRWLYVYTIR